LWLAAVGGHVPYFAEILCHINQLQILMNRSVGALRYAVAEEERCARSSSQSRQTEAPAAIEAVLSA
jgi:hypothetical protein